MTTTATPTGTLAGRWTVDPAHSRIGFAARHAMVATVRGDFASYEATAVLDPADLADARVEVTLDAKSIRTGNEQRDEHLRSGDFLDVERYPTLTFRGTRLEQVGEDTYRLIGELTVRDVTRPVSVDLTYQGSATDPFGNTRAGFEGTATISRKEFGLTWNAALEGGGVLVSDKVRLEFDLSAIKQTSNLGALVARAGAGGDTRFRHATSVAAPMSTVSERTVK